MSHTMLFQNPANTEQQNASFSNTVWSLLQHELQQEASVGKLEKFLLHQQSSMPHGSLLAHVLAEKLCDQSTPFHTLYDLFEHIFKHTPAVLHAAAQDLHAYHSRDPTCPDYITAFKTFKGFLAIQAYRIAHVLWHDAQRLSALHLQSRVSEVTGIDVHPAANLGCRLILGHGGGIVIGETTLIENDVVIMNDVTLGGTGKHGGKRHPTVRQGCLVGPGAQVLGPIELGEGAKIGAGAVVVKAVSPFRAVAGNPARSVNSHSTWPVLKMDLELPSIDYLI